MLHSIYNPWAPANTNILFFLVLGVWGLTRRSVEGAVARRVSKSLHFRVNCANALLLIFFFWSSSPIVHRFNCRTCAFLWLYHGQTEPAISWLYIRTTDLTQIPGFPHARISTRSLCIWCLSSQEVTYPITWIVDWKYKSKNKFTLCDNN